MSRWMDARGNGGIDRLMKKDEYKSKTFERGSKDRSKGTHMSLALDFNPLPATATSLL